MIFYKIFTVVILGKLTLLNVSVFRVGPKFRHKETECLSGAGVLKHTVVLLMLLQL